MLIDIDILTRYSRKNAGVMVMMALLYSGVPVRHDSER